MSKILINSTLQVILEEIDLALESDVYCSQDYLISIPDLRQSLVFYAMSRVHCRYRTVQEGGSNAPSSLEERLRVETVVRQGIQALAYKTDWRIEPVVKAASSHAQFLATH
jgi:hypothetical protein